MATVGVWAMDEDGTFVLGEPYATYLREARRAAARGWMDGLFSYLSDKCPYTREELRSEMLRRSVERGMTSDQILNEFVIEAVSGDLMPL